MAFNYETTDYWGNISNQDEYAKEVNLIRYNGAEPKVDIRTWKGKKMLKGITLTIDEARKLAEILSEEL